MKVLLSYACASHLRDVLKRTLEIQRVLFHTVAQSYETYFSGSEMEGAEIARSRNACIEYADKFGYDWVILNDVDGVIMSEPKVLPETGFAMLPTVLGRPREVPSMLVSKDRWTRGVFMLHRRFFDRRFCEGFTAYGFEDTDFLKVVMRDVDPSPCNIAAFHLWHPPRHDKINPANRELHERRIAELAMRSG